MQRRKRVETPSVADTEAAQSDVFQFLSEDTSGQDTQVDAQVDAQSTLEASSPSVTSSVDPHADHSKSDRKSVV